MGETMNNLKWCLSYNDVLDFETHLLVMSLEKLLSLFEAEQPITMQLFEFITSE